MNIAIKHEQCYPDHQRTTQVNRLAHFSYFLSVILTDKDEITPNWHLFKGPVPVRSSHLLPGVYSHPSQVLFVLQYIFHSCSGPEPLLNVSHLTASSQHRLLWKIWLCNLYPKTVPNSKTQVVSLGFFWVPLLYLIAHNWKCSRICIPGSNNKPLDFLTILKHSPSFC